MLPACVSPHERSQPVACLCFSHIMCLHAWRKVIGGVYLGPKSSSKCKPWSQLILCIVLISTQLALMWFLWAQCHSLLDRIEYNTVGRSVYRICGPAVTLWLLELCKSELLSSRHVLACWKAEQRISSSQTEILEGCLNASFFPGTDAFGFRARRPDSELLIPRSE